MNKQDFVQGKFNAAWDAVVNQADAVQAAALENVRGTMLQRVMSQAMMENAPDSGLTMGIKDVKIGKFTVDIVALAALVLTELAKVFTGEGSEVKIILSVAVFVTSLIGTISQAEEPELSDEQMVYSCILTLNNQRKEEPRGITMEDVRRSVALLDDCNAMKRKIPARIDVDVALKKLQTANRILRQGEKIKILGLASLEQV